VARHFSYAYPALFDFSMDGGGGLIVIFRLTFVV
jgi:hypothetical protein